MDNNLTYTQTGDYLVPNLALDGSETQPLGKYGRMRREYLQKERPVLWNSLILTGRLHPHLQEIDETAERRLEDLMPKLAAEAGATEDLKARDPMKWVGLMNNCKAQAEEMILAELVYN